MNAEQLFREWKQEIEHRYNLISEPTRYEWRIEHRMASDGTKYIAHMLYADIVMQWKKGTRKNRGWQFITTIQEVTQ